MWTIRQINKIFPKWIAWFFILLDFIWEFPQVIAGAVVKLCYLKYGYREVETYKQGVCQIQNWGMSSGVSLGWWQFTSPYATKDTASHEVGHSLTSLIMGWLYLPTAGLVSLVWCGIIHPRVGGSYYRIWPELSANYWSGAYGGYPPKK